MTETVDKLKEDPDIITIEMERINQGGREKVLI